MTKLINFLKENMEEIESALTNLQDKYLENGQLNQWIGSKRYDLQFEISEHEDSEEDSPMYLLVVKVTSDEEYEKIAMSSEDLEFMCDYIGDGKALEVINPILEAGGFTNISCIVDGYLDGIPYWDLPETISDGDVGQIEGGGRLASVLKEWLAIQGLETQLISDEYPTYSVATPYYLEEIDRTVNVFLVVDEESNLFSIFMYLIDIEVSDKEFENVKRICSEYSDDLKLGSLQLCRQEEPSIIRMYCAIDVFNASFEAQHITNLFHNCVISINGFIPHLNSEYPSGL